MGTGADLAISSSGSHSHSVHSSGYTVISTQGVAGSYNAASSAGIQNQTSWSTTGGASHTHASGDFTGSIGLVTGGFDGNASGSNIPKYLSCDYIMRIK